MADIIITRTVSDLRHAVRKFRDEGDRIGLVPTMGALHDGHIALVREARKRAARVIATIFVNPAQFSPAEDLAKYPRTEEADLARLSAARADILFAPTVGEMYPQGFATTISVGGPAAAGLEDRFRPTHFAGVATVVAKLFMQSGADVAMFGEKDYQQLMVVAQMARDLDLPVEIAAVATQREEDGLAMSSRNRFLSPEHRALAPLLHRTLRKAADDIAGGAGIEAALAEGRAAIEQAGFALDYLEARHAASLAPIADPAAGPVRLLVAAKIGQTRLIDNIAAT
ncbi:pantoate--beta-alanine ligase [Labrys monachus]|uniref:Pantothenate synthetase n=1 Tax=Labrys monachus TaxID=217067 RepID=A0ABU0FH29_9HYPH|nr:pantoate--beta-alanine ligase [Labrys monachus]MDQ0393926.1 pantoate--beta-alanine ligase [Labrys monachus]